MPGTVSSNSKGASGHQPLIPSWIEDRLVNVKAGSLVWVKANQGIKCIAVQVKVKSMHEDRAWVVFGKTPRPSSSETGEPYSEMQFPLDRLHIEEPSCVTTLYCFNGDTKQTDWI